MKIEFNDTHYRFTLGHAPRGFGHWCFTFEGNELWVTGTLTEAKKQCREYIRNHNAGCGNSIFVVIQP